MSSEQSENNFQLNPEGNEVLMIDKSNWLKLMKTVREAEESPRIQQCVRHRNNSTPVVEIKGVRETYSDMEELD